MPLAPLVSVIVPVYNSHRFVADTLNSALEQTYTPIEIIVMDDGSTDDSHAVLAGFGSRITLLHQPNSGCGIARNRAVEASRGKYLAFLDADDLWKPDKIERQVAVLERHPAAVATYCDHELIDATGKTLAPSAALGGPRCSGEILPNLLSYSVIVTPSLVMVRRDAFERAGAFSESGPRESEDIRLWFKLALLGPILYDLTTLVSYRRHDSNLYTGRNARFARGYLAAVQELKARLAPDTPARLRQQVDDAMVRKTLELAHQYGLENDWGKACRCHLALLGARPPHESAISLVRTTARMILSGIRRHPPASDPASDPTPRRTTQRTTDS